MGHKASQCRNKKHTSRVRTTRMDNEDKLNTRKYVELEILNKKVKLELDSGSDLTIINLQTWRKLNRPTMMHTQKIAKSITRRRINFEGEVILNVKFHAKTKTLKIFVMKDTENLVGTDWMQKFDVWDLPISSFYKKTECEPSEATKLKELHRQFPEVFLSVLGRCNKFAAKIELKKNVQPVFKKKRNVPFATTEKTDKELDRLVQTGILSKIELNVWEASVVYVKKKSVETRVCAYFSTGSNKAIKDYHYLLPNPEKIFTKLNGDKVFSKIDLSEAYLQIPAEEESTKILCINTHKELYIFNRLPFGIKVALSIFQQTMDTMLMGQNFATAYLDDILIKSDNAY